MRNADHTLRLDEAVLGLTDAKLLVTNAGAGENSAIEFGGNTLQTIPALSVYRRLLIRGGLKLLAGNVTTNSLEFIGGAVRLNAHNLIVADGNISYPDGGFVQTNGS